MSGTFTSLSNDINEFVKELQCIYFKGKCSTIVNYITSYTKKKQEGVSKGTSSLFSDT